MIDYISDEDKKRFKELFNDFLELEEQKDHIRESQKDIKEEMAGILSETKGIVSKVIGYLIKQKKKGEDELEKIYELIEGLS